MSGDLVGPRQAHHVIDEALHDHLAEASGLARGSNAEARIALRNFWNAVSDAGALSPMRPSWIDWMVRPGSLDFSPGWNIMDAFSRLWSPYQWNPTNYHPLREILNQQIDFASLRRTDKVKLFICATNVKTNRLRVFECHETSADVVLASACLPSVFQAIEIDGEHYWDGGYMGNPPIFPVIYNCQSRDVILVVINPITIEEVPRSAQAILDRINTVSFNSSLMREMRAIAFVGRLVDNGFDDAGRLKKIFIHCIDAEAEMRRLGVSSKLNVEWEFLLWLFELGRRHAEKFLEQHFDKIGTQSSTDIEARFL